jgi:hypothetical protein
MQKIKVFMRLAVIAGIGLIPAAVFGGGIYERDPWPEEQVTVRVTRTPSEIPYYASRPCEKAHRHVTYAERYDGVGGSPRMERQHFETRLCEKKIFSAPCPQKPAAAKMTQNTTVIVNNYPRKSVAKPLHVPKKVKPCIIDTCPKKLEGVKDELLTARKRALDDSFEIQKLKEENATLRERLRNREAWIENYRKEYVKHNGWR